MFVHHKGTKDNSDSTTSIITLHTCANMQPGAIATFKQLKLLDDLLNQLCHFPPPNVWGTLEKNAPLFGFQALCLPKYHYYQFPSKLGGNGWGRLKIDGCIRSIGAPPNNL